jgi:hypothetical protein
MSEAKFNKAVEIIRTVPKDGPIRPSHTEQLFVSPALAQLEMKAAFQLTCRIFIVLLILQTRLAVPAGHRMTIVLIIRLPPAQREIR